MTPSELQAELSNASAGDTVYLTDDVSVSSTIRVPAGVTLASDRGVNGSTGNTLSTEAEIPVLEAGANSRITGLRLDGPHWLYRDWSGYPTGSGLNVIGEGVEVDNCEIYGFAYTGVNGNADTHIHDCFIHHNPQNGLGYGVLSDSGHVTIENCDFNYNRHAVAATEGPNGYTVENCWFGPDTIHHVIDHRGPTLDSRIVIRGNTFEATHKIENENFADSGAETEAIRLRSGGLAGETIIENNNFAHPQPSPCGGEGEAIWIGSCTDWSEKNVTLQGNQFTAAPGNGETPAGAGLSREAALALLAVGVGAVIVWNKK